MTHAGTVAAILTMIGGATALTGCGTTGPRPGSCEDREQALTTQLHAVGDALLQPLPYTTSEFSGCEEKGIVDPYVYYNVKGWTSCKEGRSFLRKTDWVRETKRSQVTKYVFKSPDAQWVAVPDCWTEGTGTRGAIKVTSRAQYLQDIKPK